MKSLRPQLLLWQLQPTPTAAIFTTTITTSTSSTTSTTITTTTTLF